MKRWKRWPIIRHVRWYMLQRNYWEWWYEVGFMLGAFPNPADLKYMQDVWEGRE